MDQYIITKSTCYGSKLNYEGELDAYMQPLNVKPVRSLRRQYHVEFYIGQVRQELVCPVQPELPTMRL